MYARHYLQIGWACNESFLDNQQMFNGRLDGRGEERGAPIMILLSSVGTGPRRDCQMGMMDRIDAHLHLARISSFPPARLADPIILLSFGGWSSAVVSGRGLHVYGCMVFGIILSPPPPPRTLLR